MSSGPLRRLAWCPRLAKRRDRAHAQRGPGGSALALVPVLAAMLVAFGCGEPAPDRCLDCNVFLITVDTLRADHVSAYGYERETTPQLTRFFASGTRFRHAVSASPCTIPSVRQLLTGRIVPSAADARLAEVLLRNGWETAAVVSHQFFRDASGPLPAYARGFERFDVQSLQRHGAYGMTLRTAEEVTDRALALLQDWDAERPLFLWLHYFDPHDPYLAPPEHRVFEPRGSETIDGDRRAVMRDGRGMGLPWEERGGIFSEEEVDFLVSQYDAEIRYVDAEIGRFLAALERRGLIDQSLVLLTSDHGERLGEELKWDHCWSLHESEMRVPLMVRLGGGRLGGQAEARFGASNLDLVPTVLDVLGLDAGPGHAGRSLVSLARVDAPSRVVRTAWKDQALALLPPWKLVRDGEGASALYDLERDPGEQRDLSAERPALTRALERSLGEAGAALSGAASQSDAVLNRLQALGYVE